MERDTIEVTYSLTKPAKKLYAGVYIQEPNGLVDSHGIAWRDISEEVKVTDDTIPPVARSIVKIFKHFPELKKIVFYRQWRKKPYNL